MFTRIFTFFLMLLRLWSVPGQSISLMSKTHWEKKEPEIRKAQTFSFASYYGDHMVLQKAPKRAIVWGYSPDIGEQVSLKVSNGDSYTTNVYLDPVYKYGVWKVKLRPESSPGPFTVTAMSKGLTIDLNDVMFGDVWVCSGQSNMVFTVHQGFNASAEFADANNYPDIRVFTVDYNVSSTPIQDIQGRLEPWTRGSSVAVHGEPKPYFSAVCWFYGRALFKRFGYPIGLITSAWSGTQIETWSSPDALGKCGLQSPDPENYNQISRDTGRGQIGEKSVFPFTPTTPSCLWNGMIHPFINMTIYGAIWYQGESNTLVNANKYNCTFPAMIDDWREKFHDGSDGETSAKFPFGFVQLGPNSSVSDIQGYPEVRWHQTADYGYVPNPRMQNVFMAVAVDLTDFASPYGGVHIRDKQDVAARLFLSGVSVAYNQTGIIYQGPLPSQIVEGTDNITLHYATNITYQNMVGFEALCTVKNSSVTFWIQIPILNPLFEDRIYLWPGVCGQGETVLGLRYLWQESPCAFKTCTVYSAANPFLPGPPFIVYKRMTKVPGTVHTIDWSTPITVSK